MEVSPLQQEEAGKAQGAKRSVWPWHGSISQDWEAKVEARPGVDGVVERQDRQVASYLSAKQAPWVRIPLLPLVLRMWPPCSSRLFWHVPPVVTGASMRRWQITRIQVSLFVSVRPRCCRLHACLPGKRSGFDSRWPLFRIIGREVRRLPSKQIYADSISAWCSGDGP